MTHRLLVINVLSEQDFLDCHIQGSTNVPLQTLDFYVQHLDKNIPIVVYCGSYKCNASSQAYKELIDLGFTKVQVYEGGIAQWRQLGYPTQGLCASSFLKHHFSAITRSDINAISAQELKTLMESHGLLPSPVEY